MVGYIILLLWVLFSLKLKNVYFGFASPNTMHPSKRYAYFSSFGVVLITGLRHWTTGPDSDSYSSYFLNLHNGIYLSGYARFEKGYEILSKFLALFTGNYTFYFLVIAAIVMIFVGVYLYRATAEYFWAIFLYITIGTFIFQITGLRQAVAMAICAYSVIYVKEKKIISFFILVVLATQFHTSALVFLPLYFLGRMRFGIKSIVLLLIGVFTVLSANEWITTVSNQLLGYDKGYEEAAGGYVNIILYLGVIVVSLLYDYHAFTDTTFRAKAMPEQAAFDAAETEKSELRQYNLIALNMTIITFVMYFMRYWLRMAERASKYYSIGVVVLLANLVVSVKNERDKRIIKFVVFCLAIALFVYRQTREGSEYIYHFFWYSGD